MVSKSNKDALRALAISLVLVSILCLYVDPSWETNDDIAMSMVAHGYGLAAVSSPNLIFSNVVWGYIVQSIPKIYGVLGYSLATLGTLVLFGMVVLFALRRVGVGWITTCAVVMVLLVRPVLFPQFTINAGLLTVGAFVCWFLYGTRGGKFTLVAGSLLAFCGYLVRSHEFVLVLLIAAPLLPWTRLIKDRFVQMTSLALLIAVGGAMYVDQAAYQAQDWQEFNALNPARAPFTDFGADRLLKQRPDILSRFNYSENDVDLVRSWFFAAPDVANPVVLSAMLDELGPIPEKEVAVASGWKGITTLAHPTLFPYLFLALVLAALRPSRKLLLAWGLCFTAFFTLGVIGRPGVLRVYIPVMSLMLIAPLLAHRSGLIGNNRVLQRLGYGLIVVVALTSTYSIMSNAKNVQSKNEQIRSALKKFPFHTAVVWGSGFPFESVYAVLRPSDAELRYQLYGLGVFTLAPFSRAYIEQKRGQGLVELLRSSTGVRLIANDHSYGLLEIYCKEHFNGRLIELSRDQYGEVHASQLQCVSEIKE